MNNHMMQWGLRMQIKREYSPQQPYSTLVEYINSTRDARRSPFANLASPAVPHRNPSFTSSTKNLGGGVLENQRHPSEIGFRMACVFPSFFQPLPHPN
jgi:hypothetical protein